MKPRNNRARSITLIALAEIALIALIVVTLAGRRLATVADMIDAVPGGRLVVAGLALILLLVAAFAMTILLSR